MPKFGGKGTITLFSVQGNVEQQMRLLTVDRICEQLGLTKPEKKTVGKFVLPIVPNQGDFFFFPFRLLSKTIVGSGSWKSTNFSKGSVLKDSVKKIAGKPAFLNHEQVAGREIGFMGDDAEWVDSYQLEGEKIPAGIEGSFVLDSKLEGAASMPSNADLIRRLSGPVPMIKACSMSVLFEWESSHEFEREGDFWYHVGEMIDGKEVTRDCTVIHDYGEGSLCYQGADPFARKLDSKGKLLFAKMMEDDGTIIDIDSQEAFAKMKFSADNAGALTRRYYVVDGLDKESLLTLSKANAKYQPATSKTFPMNEELLLFITASFGMTADDIKAGKFDKAKADKFKIIASSDFAKLKSDEDYNKIVGEKKTSEDALALEKTTHEKAKTDLTAANEKLSGLSVMAKAGETVLNAAKTEAKRIYGIFAKGKEDATITADLEKESDILKLEAQIKMWGGQAITDFSGVCAECGSHEINFRKSEVKDSGQGGKGDKAQNTKSSLTNAARRM